MIKHIKRELRRIVYFNNSVLYFRKLGIPGLFIGSLLTRLLSPFYPLLSRRFIHCFEFFCIHGYWPRLNSPRSLNEKILYSMFIRSHPLSGSVADKFKVREYVQKKVLQNILVDLYWAGNRPENIPFDELPSKFVIKANHGSAWNIIVPDKNAIDRNKIISQCKEWLTLKYSDHLNEKHYDSIEPMIIVEEYIEDRSYTIPLDYKYFCFHGKIAFIHVDFDRFTVHKRNCFDNEWNRLPFKILFDNKEISFPRPKKFGQMNEIAEKLSEDFDFCRVDLYCPDDQKIYFGEITMAPGAGFIRFTPREWDFKFGKLWKLDQPVNVRQPDNVEMSRKEEIR